MHIHTQIQSSNMCAAVAKGAIPILWIINYILIKYSREVNSTKSAAYTLKTNTHLHTDTGHNIICTYITKQTFAQPGLHTIGGHSVRIGL